MSNTFPPKFPFSVRDPLHRDRELLRRNREYQNAPSQTAVGDTENVLTESGFDMCLALSQQAINSQMQVAWKAWKHRKNIGNTIDISQLIKTESGIKPSKYGLRSVVLDEPYLDLSVQNVKLGQVKVTLTLASGVVRYFDEETEEAATYTFSNWRISFITDLSKKSVDTKILATIDSVSAEAVQTLIQQSGLPESVFSIEFLFLRLTDVNCLLLDNKNIEIPEDVPSAAKDKALSSLNALLQGEMGEFMLGTVVRRNKAQATPTFAMTDFIFDVHADTAVAEASTLNYLGMMSQRPLPANLDTARIKMADAWVRPEQLDGTVSMVSGVMAISKSVFMDQYLIPKFTGLIGKAPIAKGLTWTFLDGSQGSWQTGDIIDRKWSKGRDWTLTLSVVPGTTRVNISGRVSSYAKMDGYTKEVDLGRLGDLGGYHTEWIHIAGHQDFSGSIQLNEGSRDTEDSARNFVLTATVTNEFNGLVVDEKETEGGAKVLTVFQDVFTGSTFEESLSNAQREDVNNIRVWLDQVIKNVGLDLSQHAFIPPGGGVFTFQNPRFSKAGDLLFDVIYKAP